MCKHLVTAVLGFSGCELTQLGDPFCEVVTAPLSVIEFHRMIEQSTSNHFFMQ